MDGELGACRPRVDGPLLPALHRSPEHPEHRLGHLPAENVDRVEAEPEALPVDRQVHEPAGSGVDVGVCAQEKERRTAE